VFDRLLFDLGLRVHGLLFASVVTPVAAYVLHTHWAERYPYLKAHYTTWWPSHKEKWRWIKDDNMARVIVYFFPFLVQKNGALIIPFSGFLFQDLDSVSRTIAPVTTHRQSR
jgi:hypothetical protein